jgi:23S rRNA (adenine2503-C2)-methyltransferase
MKKTILAGLSPEDLSGIFGSLPSFRPLQIYDWICRGVNVFEKMTNLPSGLRRHLDENCRVLPFKNINAASSKDGAVKLAITLDDDLVIEAVVLSDAKGRKTACLSTQAGCPAACLFCKTGSLGFNRNLSASEISGQFLLLKQFEAQISHIVIMGMGEPLFNLVELRKALAFFMDERGLKISKRKITLSTCGIENGILDLTKEGPDIRLALSLNSARQDLRDSLMPVSRENPLPQLKNALSFYQSQTGRRITLEMVLLGGLNTGAEDVKAASAFAEGLNSVFNIIPWNFVDGLEFEGSKFRPPSRQELSEFITALEAKGHKVTMRHKKGQSICGACGQLGLLLPALEKPAIIKA